MYLLDFGMAKLSKMLCKRKVEKDLEGRLKV